MRSQRCIERHGETLRSIIESVIHEQAEAEDVLQETLLQIWKQAQNYAPRVGKPLGWLTTYHPPARD